MLNAPKLVPTESNGSGANGAELNGAVSCVDGGCVDWGGVGRGCVDGIAVGVLDLFGDDVVGLSSNVLFAMRCDTSLGAASEGVAFTTTAYQTSRPHFANLKR